MNKKPHFVLASKAAHDRGVSLATYVYLLPAAGAKLVWVGSRLYVNLHA